MKKSSFFKNKLVWITGASSGIGEHLTYQLANLEANLVISARTESELQRVKANCNNNANIMVLPLDLSDINSIKDKVKKVKEVFGKIDILINNAGIGQNGFVADTQINIYQKVLDINLIGTITLTKAVAPILQAQGHGQITIVSSILGHVVLPKYSAYSMSKHALNAFAHTIRLELKKDNIQVLLVCPGATQTNMEEKAINGSGKVMGIKPKEYETWLLPEKVAQKIIIGIQSGKREVIIGHCYEKLAVFINRYFPSIYFKLAVDFE
ncbi:short-chain dehydrogenase of unknown substrate specificity [Xenococcus sp. PCC 7305]|uniref:SDR family oxidoreductase n=1 Tax=Xenococcus sp. PCC 7305 TaxID=102125 RepID=UPI0002AC58CE|nr:SDR family oxidoreductase [Xenococcus sp. PCC 7305]ELS01020.1 short-chain dehydrogenase of unknown substrate specificity [Xenococcus sp. PCC 7305]